MSSTLVKIRPAMKSDDGNDKYGNRIGYQTSEESVLHVSDYVNVMTLRVFHL